MERPNLISLLLTGLSLVMFTVSCSKDGADGPAGPAGPKGDAGTDVIYSSWLDVAFKADTVHLAGGGIDTIGYYATINVPKLTSALLGTADVKAYINSSDASDPVIYALPYSAINGLFIEFSAYTQNIQIYSNADLTTYSRNGKKYYQFRYMIVPGNAQARSAVSVNWSDYAAVKAYFGLKD